MLNTELYIGTWGKQVYVKTFPFTTDDEFYRLYLLSGGTQRRAFHVTRARKLKYDMFHFLEQESNPQTCRVCSHCATTGLKQQTIQFNTKVSYNIYFVFHYIILWQIEGLVCITLVHTSNSIWSHYLRVNPGRSVPRDHCGKLCYTRIFNFSFCFYSFIFLLCSTNWDIACWFT